jgi:hypothetical protein
MIFPRNRALLPSISVGDGRAGRFTLVAILVALFALAAGWHATAATVLSPANHATKSGWLTLTDPQTKRDLDQQHAVVTRLLTSPQIARGMDAIDKATGPEQVRLAKELVQWVGSDSGRQAAGLGKDAAPAGVRIGDTSKKTILAETKPSSGTVQIQNHCTWVWGWWHGHYIVIAYSVDCNVNYPN